MSEQTYSANDYALAKYLDERVVAIFALIANSHGDLPDLSSINRSYVLLVNELKHIYERNDKLSSIAENICWRTFGTIDVIDPYMLHEYSDDYNNHGNDHISKVNELCIINDKESPDITPQIKKLVNDANVDIAVFIANQIIPEYTFEITSDGTLLVNGMTGIMLVTKVQAGSKTDMALTQAKELPNVIFTPDLKGHGTKRSLRTSLAEVGFTGAIEKLFLPILDNQRGIKFRPIVTRAEANTEGIDLLELDEWIKMGGRKNAKVSTDIPK